MIEPITLEDVELKEQSESNKKKKGQNKTVNLVEMIKDALDTCGYQFAYNELSKEIELLDENGMPTIMDDYLYSRIVVDLWQNDYPIKESTLQRVIIGGMATAYHPVKKYFETLPEWDGLDHIAKLAETVDIDDMGLDLKKQWPEYLRRWLVACAAQATIEKATNHTCLVLMGAQGKGKTTFLNALCPPELNHLLYTGHINVTEKDTMNLLAEKFIINIDDQLDIMGDLRKLKSMFTMEKVVNRKAYAKFSPSRPRIASFVASVNSTEFLTDDENRRYLVFSIKDIDLPGIKKIDRAQLFAQVVALLNRGFRYWFDKEENELISNINDSFRVKPEEEELLIQHFEADDNGIPMMQNQIFNHLQVRSASKLNSKKLTVTLKKLGFIRKSARIEGKLHPVYVYLVREIPDYERDQMKDKIITQEAESGSDGEQQQNHKPLKMPF